MFLALFKILISSLSYCVKAADNSSTTQKLIKPGNLQVLQLVVVGKLSVPGTIASNRILFQGCRKLSISSHILYGQLINDCT